MMNFSVSTQKNNALCTKMAKFSIKEADIQEAFIHSGGKGGQNVNKVATCVQLIHAPTGIIIKCSRTRKQGLNRYWAYVLLTEKIEALVTTKKSEQRDSFEKARRTNRKRSMRSKQRMLDAKKHQANKKSQRRDIII